MTAPSPRKPMWKRIHPLSWLVILLVTCIIGYPVIQTVRILVHWAQKDQSPPPDIAVLLRDDFRLALPEDSRVLHAHRQPNGMDSAGLYELQIPLAKVAGFIASLQANAQLAGWSTQTRHEALPSYVVPSPPAWWTPQGLKDADWLEIQHLQHGVIYHVCYAPSSGRCFIFWFTT